MGKFAFIRIGNPYWDSLIRIDLREDLREATVGSPV